MRQRWRTSSDLHECHFVLLHHIKAFRAIMMWTTWAIWGEGHVLKWAIWGEGHVLKWAIWGEGHVLKWAIWGEGHVLKWAIWGRGMY